MASESRPLPVRVLGFAGWAALLLSLVAFGIGALLGFDELAKIWAVIAGILLFTAIMAFLGTRPTTGGLVAGLVACTLLLLIPPIGTVITIAIALIASQSWPQIREYYGLRRKAA
ncbi:MAG TPA: hypothetical protein VJ922_06655 [Actinomycetota bacterium]|nr:hypothetical protein [Actinomycetota bacterium]